MAATPSMKNRDTTRDFHYFFMFDDENEAKVSRSIGAIDHDGWAYITYGPHYDPVQALNLTLFNFAQAANNFANTVNAMNTANAPTQPPSHGILVFAPCKCCTRS